MSKENQPTKEEMEKEYNIVTLKKMRWRSAMMDSAWNLELKRNPSDYVR